MIIPLKPALLAHLDVPLVLMLPFVLLAVAIDRILQLAIAFQDILMMALQRFARLAYSSAQLV